MKVVTLQNILVVWALIMKTVLLVMAPCHAVQSLKGAGNVMEQRRVLLA